MTHHTQIQICGNVITSSEDGKLLVMLRQRTARIGIPWNDNIYCKTHIFLCKFILITNYVNYRKMEVKFGCCKQWVNLSNHFSMGWRIINITIYLLNNIFLSDFI